MAYDKYDELFVVDRHSKEKISVERISLLLGCSGTMAQRIRSAMKTMTREEILELIQKRLGVT